MELNFNLFNSHIKDFNAEIYKEKSSKNNLESHFLFYELYQKLIRYAMYSLLHINKSQHAFLIESPFNLG